jgi:hypothetical protein
MVRIHWHSLHAKTQASLGFIIGLIEIQRMISNYDFFCQFDNLLYHFIPKNSQKRQKKEIIWL